MFALTSSVGADGGGFPSGTNQDDQYSSAVEAIESENYARGVRMLRKLVKKKPNNADAWNYLGYG